MVITKDAYGMAEVSTDNTGNLTCVKCNTLWCDHIQDVIRSGADWESIQKVYEHCKFVTVPVRPTEKVSAIVWLEKMDRPVWRSKVYLQSPLRADPERVCRGDDWLIGIIGQGEGRMVIRNLVIEAFTDKTQYDMVVACESRFHDWNRRADLAQRMRDGKMMDRLVQAWHSQWYKRCTFCMEEEDKNGMPGWDPALIPDVSDTPKRRPPYSTPRPRRPYTSRPIPPTS